MEVLIEASAIWYPEKSFERGFFQKKRQILYLYMCDFCFSAKSANLSCTVVATTNLVCMCLDITCNHTEFNS